MRAGVRRIYEVCVRALKWTSAHVVNEPGLAVLVAQLQVLVARMAQVISDQRRGLIDARAATARKRDLRRTILAMPIAHLAEIGKRAGREVHELGKAFSLRPKAGTRAAFQAAVRMMYAEAQAHKEVLVKHGLSEAVLAELGQMLDEFDAAVQLGADGRMMHTAATQELETLAKERTGSCGRWTRRTGSGSGTTRRRWRCGSARGGCWGFRGRTRRRHPKWKVERRDRAAT